LLLRETIRVEVEIENCQSGRVTSHYQTGHPHAYINAMYMGELAISKMLWDNAGNVTALKSVAEIYPPKLKSALIEFFLFEAGFSLMFATAHVTKDDGYYVSAHIVRAISCLNQVLFALNEQYCLNEKKAVRMIDEFAIKPANYKICIDELFCKLGNGSVEACQKLNVLIDETKNLCH
jgi:hypothetical protein